MRSLLSPAKLGYLIELLASTKHVEGAIAEVGVFNGGCLEAIVKSCETWQPPPDIYGYDTFEGLPASLDYEYHNQGEFSADEVEVRKRFEPYPNVQLIKGLFPQTHRHAKIKNFRFIHLDVDLYESTRDSLFFIWPLLSSGGVLVADDYRWEHTPGVTKAVDEFMEHFGVEAIGKAPHGQIAFRKNPSQIAGPWPDSQG